MQNQKFSESMSQVTPELQAEHQAWLEQIRKWENELDKLVEINGQIVTQAETKEGQKSIEHFENRFAIQKNRLDQMKHNIKLYGGNVSKGQNELDEYKEYYNNLKEEFQKFSSSFS